MGLVGLSLASILPQLLQGGCGASDSLNTCTSSKTHTFILFLQGTLPSKPPSTKRSLQNLCPETSPLHSGCRVAVGDAMPTVPASPKHPSRPPEHAGEKPLALMGEGLPPCKGRGLGLHAFREEGI
jgi:hypothetical protein